MLLLAMKPLRDTSLSFYFRDLLHIPQRAKYVVLLSLCVLCLSWRDQTSIFRGEETYCCLFARSYHLSLAKSEHTSTKIQYTAKIPLLYTWLNTFYLMSFVLFEDKFWLLVVYHPNKSDPINGQFRIQRKLFQHKMLSRTVSLSLLSTVNLWERRTIDNFWLCLAHPFLSSIQT